MRHLPMLLLTIIPAALAHAEIHTEPVDYKHGQVKLRGYLAYDDELEGRRPGVLIVHEWWGLNDYAKARARRLAELGYVAFALDMYGAGKATADKDLARKWSGELYGKPLQAERAKVGSNVLLNHKLVDRKRVAAIGYCFGGTTVLKLAFSGADIAGVVSFHGSLPPPKPAHKIKAKILVCHGADDPFIKPEQLAAFKVALRERKVDWQLISYGGAVHSFTNPAAAKSGIEGVNYHAAADKRSWRHMRAFFDELFKE